MLAWNGVVGTVRFGFSLRKSFELFCKGDVVKEGPGVVELVVPGSLEVAHGREEFEEFFITHEREEGGVYARRVWIVGSVIVGAPERFRGLAHGCKGSVEESCSRQ